MKKGLSMFFSVNVPFNEREVRDYERRRYRGLDQRLVHRREVRILGAIMKLIGPTPDRASPGSPPEHLALDAPCGYGRFSRFLLERGYRLASADLSFAMVKRARGRENIPAIPIIPMGIVCNFVAGLPFKPAVFEIILSMRLFHHLHRPEERQSVLREFGRAAGGWVILSYYQANLLHRFQRTVRRAIKRSRTRIKMISRREFREEVGAAGFEIVRVFPLFRGIHGHHIALLKIGDSIHNTQNYGTKN